MITMNSEPPFFGETPSLLLTERWANPNLLGYFTYHDACESRLVATPGPAVHIRGA
jgi:hypothetical protein